MIGPDIETPTTPTTIKAIVPGDTGPAAPGGPTGDVASRGAGLDGRSVTLPSKRRV